MNMAKTVLISGGTDGLGKGAAIQLLKDGFRVATFSRNDEKCRRLQEELSKQFDAGQFLVLQGDVNDQESLISVVEKTLKQFKTIDILINNAGFGYFTSVDQVDMKRFQDMVQTNLVGVALLTKLVTPHMKKQKSGLIINLASISGKQAFAMGEFYSATKFGVMGYSEAIRNELKDDGIKICTLCPGMVKTSFFDKEELERRKKIWKGKIPQMLTVEDVTRLISLICTQSEHSDIQDVTIMPF